MDVREKLVELIAQKVCDTWSESCDEWLPHDCGKCYANDCHISELADHLIINGVTVQEWVPADKRMPTQEDAPTEYVFTAYKNQNCYDVGIALWDTVVACPDLYDYWMALPLPQPPKGE